jgi:hypothetical protein
LLVYKNRAAFADIFPACNCDNRFDIIRKIDDGFVISRTDQNIAVAQNKRRVASKLAGKIDNAARTVLHGLRDIVDVDIVMLTIAKKVPHCVGVITNDN